MAGKLYTSEVWLKKRFLIDKKSPEDIAKECGASAIARPFRDKFLDNNK